MKIFLLSFIALALLGAQAYATQLMDTFDDWRVFQVSQDDGTVCYIGSTPINKQGNYSKRGDAFVLVTDKGGNLDEISVSSGYPYKENKEVAVQIGQRSHALFSKGELAWAPNSAEDKAIVKDMIRGAEMVVRGTSWKGTTSKDTYSLKGFTDAHRAMKKLCSDQ